VEERERELLARLLPPELERAFPPYEALELEPLMAAAGAQLRVDRASRDGDVLVLDLVPVRPPGKRQRQLGARLAKPARDAPEPAPLPMGSLRHGPLLRLTQSVPNLGRARGRSPQGKVRVFTNVRLHQGASTPGLSRLAISQACLRTFSASRVSIRRSRRTTRPPTTTVRTAPPFRL